MEQRRRPGSGLVVGLGLAVHLVDQGSDVGELGGHLSQGVQVGQTGLRLVVGPDLVQVPGGLQDALEHHVWWLVGVEAIDQPEDVTDASQRSASDPEFGRPSKSLCRRRPGPHIGLQAV